MEFFRNPKINFVGGMKPAFSLSVVLIIASCILLLINGGPRLSIDFTGGSVLQVRIDPVPSVSEIRTALENEGYPGVQVTEFGSTDEFLITFPQVEEGTETLDAAAVMLNAAQMIKSS